MRGSLLVLIALVAVACGGSEPLALAPTAGEGRAALAAAEGKPHVLWFWGAH